MILISKIIPSFFVDKASFHCKSGTKNEQIASLVRMISYLFCRDLDACKHAAMMYSLFQIKV